jgi:ABC-type branched-subunit amino acid transport system ATPase component
MARHVGWDEAKVKKRVEELAALAQLDPVLLDRFPAELSGGQRQRVGLVRALMLEPELLLLDEPAAGMNSEEIGQLRARILSLRERGITILLIEHVMELVMGVADRIVVLNFGQKIAEGPPAEIRADPLVRRAYLGGGS